MTDVDRQEAVLSEEAALRVILEGTAAETGEQFFLALVRKLTEALGTYGAWVTEYDEPKRRLRALAFRLGDRYVDGYEYAIAGTPCEPVIDQACLVHYPDRVIELFPDDPDLKAFDAVSYMGAPLQDLDGRILGHLAVVDNKRMPRWERLETLFRIFAGRAAAELRRLRAEAQIREREEKLGRLFAGAMDAIVEIDRELRVSMFNPAAERFFGVTAQDAMGTCLDRFLQDAGRRTLTRVMAKLDTADDDRQYQWIEGLTGVRADGTAFPAEATLARAAQSREPFYTLILRNVNDRLAAEQTIRTLSEEQAYLIEEIRELTGFEEIIGECEPMHRMLADLHRVASTDATVLITGETGTGKELVARAIHKASTRSRKPLIKVNCAAIPASLIESEFFGHEKGAFTGATAAREGRFALADGGTIFLDEIGELPLELQPKLLRVLQEGEFEPVGGSRTRKVDVRVIAATNRDLDRMVREGAFREDLYYRLNVFPVRVPPLRERGEDVVRLAKAFAERAAHRLGRPSPRLSEGVLTRIRSYDWPGNVRELQNVIERALITANGSGLNLDRALPETAEQGRPMTAMAQTTVERRVRTAVEMVEFERENIRLALEGAGWRVSGAQGAASRLGLPPSTLTSRMKALGIHRPR